MLHPDVSILGGLVEGHAKKFWEVIGAELNYCVDIHPNPRLQAALLPACWDPLNRGKSIAGRSQYPE